ncbi:MAG: insulinase family protein [Chitinophagales bacterium]|nr:insulinase family protein [Chitinophagales bacterium]
MRKISIFLFLIPLLFSCKQKVEKLYQHDFEVVEGDDSNTLKYTLENGLSVYLSVNKTEPRIQTLIGVKAGSKFDPAETTGLAHYLEHMMFKGTDVLGTKDWESEKRLLDLIAAAYEEHRLETDPEKKTAIYAKIDSLSLEASKFAIANEYDKMVSALGAKGTNAYTSNEQTVYVNDIPSNEIEKWLKIEGERFQTLVLRLFHTELETVYEEFNRSQDNDGRWVYQAVLEGLLPNHPYGTQTTIGLGEHLKNPSMYNIHDYFNKYYVPNNVTICLAGDLDPDATIDLIEKYFSSWERQNLEPLVVPEDKPLTQPVVKEIFGPQQEMLYMGYKFPGVGTKEAMKVQLIDMLLANSQAGLIDIDLMLKQKVLSAGSFPQVLKDHTIHFLYGVPKEGQSLEEVRDLLLAEVEKIKRGEFDDWLLEAVVNDLKLSRIKSLESNSGRANLALDAFINELSLEEAIFDLDTMALITKEELVAFAKENYGENYAIAYKRMGVSDRHSVPKPQISAVEVDRESKSTFYLELDSMKSLSLEPKFIDFKKDISFDKLDEVEMAYVHNEQNEIFNLYYLVDIGSNTDKELALAIQYLPYLGTSKYSAEDLSKEFYRYGLEFGVNAGSDQVSVYLSGLEENLEKGLELFEHLLAEVQANSEVYVELVNDIEKARANAKLDKNTILRTGLASIAKYGMENPFTDRLSSASLQEMDVEKLSAKIKDLMKVKHRIFYYGSIPMEDAKAKIAKYHLKVSNLEELPAKKIFPELTKENAEVLYSNYDMQQVEILFLAKDEVYNPNLLAAANLFNEYFGAGLSSIVFQEIREKKALAYSAYSYYSSPSEAEKSHYVNAYIGTQADKLEEASKAMFELMNEMPKAQMQFDAAKEAVIKKLESDWTTGSSIYWAYERAKKLNLDYDVNQKIYEQVQAMSLEDLNHFFEKHIKGKQYSICVIGNEEKIDFKQLEQMGKLQKFSLEEIFAY